MAENVAEDFSLERLSAQTGLSKLHFQRLFKRATGVSPSRYHINLRMNAARRLLRETKKSVVDIPLDVGYATPSHFAKLFRGETGLSPAIIVSNVDRAAQPLRESNSEQSRNRCSKTPWDSHARSR